MNCGRGPVVFLIQLTLAIGMLLAEAAGPSSAAANTLDAHSSEQALQRLSAAIDALIKRIDQLEARVERIEKSLAPARFRPDRYGIIRDAQGRPIGIWGVDHDLERAR